MSWKCKKKKVWSASKRHTKEYDNILIWINHIWIRLTCTTHDFIEGIPDIAPTETNVEWIKFQCWTTSKCVISGFLTSFDRLFEKCSSQNTQFTSTSCIVDEPEWNLNTLGLISQFINSESNKRMMPAIHHLKLETTWNDGYRYLLSQYKNLMRISRVFLPFFLHHEMTDIKN